MKFNFSEEVELALAEHRAVVALESTVIAHGLPFPQNIETALEMESLVRDGGAIPATIAVFDGEFFVGLNHAQIERLAEDKDIKKISRRDLVSAAAFRWNCATTVATTTFAALRAGIRVFATGGIGGVHRGFSADVSADLPELAQTPIAVVCAGAKLVLDLPQTREWLETHGIPVIGWQCDEMPAFYSRISGLAVDATVRDAEEVAKMINARDDLNLKQSILLTVPIPEEFEISRDEMEDMILRAVDLAEKNSIRGKELTPNLLSYLSEASGGRTLTANIALLQNNAKIAAKIAVALAES